MFKEWIIEDFSMYEMKITSCCIKRLDTFVEKSERADLTAHLIQHYASSHLKSVCVAYNFYFTIEEYICGNCINYLR